MSNVINAQERFIAKANKDALLNAQKKKAYDDVFKNNMQKLLKRKQLELLNKLEDWNG